MLAQMVLDQLLAWAHQVRVQEPVVSDPYREEAEAVRAHLDLPGHTGVVEPRVFLPP